MHPARRCRCWSALTPQSPVPSRSRARGAPASPAQEWRPLAVATVAACLVAILVGDVFRWSVLGYSIRLGVRFYGVGNEFMGWWIGAALLAVGVPEVGRVRIGALGLLLAVTV